MYPFICGPKLLLCFFYLTNISYTNSKILLLEKSEGGMICDKALHNHLEVQRYFYYYLNLLIRNIAE